jgi:hypothetical protein
MCALTNGFKGIKVKSGWNMIQGASISKINTHRDSYA